MQGANGSLKQNHETHKQNHETRRKGGNGGILEVVGYSSDAARYRFKFQNKAVTQKYLTSYPPRPPFLRVSKVLVFQILAILSDQCHQR